MSAHVLGAALDFDVEGMSSEGVRNWLYEHALELPYPIRLEMKVDWVHLDVATEGPDKIVWF
uniref:Peptidase n=1 Tax=viral metagenome TaxID=1070528 RepID=A0A6M3LGB1_9ZZZZ